MLSTEMKDNRKEQSDTGSYQGGLSDKKSDRRLRHKW